MTSCFKRKLFTYAKYSHYRHILDRTRALQLVVNRSSSTAHQQAEEFGDESEDQDGRQPLYPGHIPTSVFQKALLTAGSTFMSLFDPTRGHSIATLGDVTANLALKAMKQKMEADPVGRQILEEQPVINTNTLSVEYLGSLPDNTFGKEYWRFLDKNGFSPDARLPVHFVDDPELVYVMLRYRQCHDLVHTVLGMKPNMLGEVVVKWVEAIQTGLPMCQLAAVFGPLRLGPVHRNRYLTSYLPWAIRQGRNGKCLMTVYFEKEWERDLTELRQELNIEPPPPIV